jgi:hypothetical protein
MSILLTTVKNFGSTGSQIFPHSSHFFEAQSLTLQQLFTILYWYAVCMISKTDSISWLSVSMQYRFDSREQSNYREIGQQ